MIITHISRPGALLLAPHQVSRPPSSRDMDCIYNRSLKKENWPFLRLRQSETFCLIGMKLRKGTTSVLDGCMYTIAKLLTESFMQKWWSQNAHVIKITILKVRQCKIFCLIGMKLRKGTTSVLVCFMCTISKLLNGSFMQKCRSYLSILLKICKNGV